jgi:RHS repeat-associated protein
VCICGSDNFYHYDGQLSTRQLTDASAQVTDKYTYDAFGLLLNRSGSTENDYLYTGEQYDPNVGFYYLRARYYNPANGRFLTMDTWPGMRFEPLSLHKYLYCESGPVGKWDPSGFAYTLRGLAATIYGRAIIGSALGGFGYLASWLCQGGNFEDFNKYDLLLSIAFGATANVLGGIFAAAKASTLINVAINAFLSAILYTSHYLWSGDDWNTWALVMSIGFGGLAGVIAGKGAVGGNISSLLRGGLGSISGAVLTALVEGMKKYIENSNKPEYVQPALNLIDHIFPTGPAIFKFAR